MNDKVLTLTEEFEEWWEADRRDSWARATWFNKDPEPMSWYWGIRLKAGVREWYMGERYAGRVPEMPNPFWVRYCTEKLGVEPMPQAKKPQPFLVRRQGLSERRTGEPR